MAERKRNIVRAIIQEMSGKVANSPNSFWTRLVSNSFRPKIGQIDYNSNDYDLFRSIYHNSVVNGKGANFQMAAALGKPIVNITAGYVVGRGFKVELENPEQLTLISEAEEAINEWLNDNRRHFFNIAKHGYRDGDSYLHIDEFGRLTELDAISVEERLDPVTSVTIGFDVVNNVTLVETSELSAAKTETKWVYVKQYRTDSTRIFRYKDGQPDSVEILWERVYTANGAIPLPMDEEGKSIGINAADIRERRLAVKAFHNEPEPAAVYGNSDYQNLLNLFEGYSKLLEHGTRGAMYNSVPIPVLRGVQNPNKVQTDENGEPIAADKGNGVSWGQDKVIYLEGDKSDAKMLQGNAFMDDLGKLLEIYFYLFVQGSETPEFAFGTAVASSKASTETQSPVLGKKIERKQMEFTDFITDVVSTLIERRLLMSDPQFLPLADFMPKIRVTFPPIDEEDKTVLLTTVQWAFENSMLTAEKVLDLILGDKVKNVSEELREAAEEARKRVEEAPAASDRLITELLRQGNTTTPPTEPVTE